MPLNWLSVLAGSLMVADSIFTWRSKGRIRWIQIVFPIILLAMVAWLFTLHPQIDAFVDADTRQIGGDYDQFYWLHRLYLWASTVQWVAAWMWLICWLIPGKELHTET